MTFKNWRFYSAKFKNWFRLISKGGTVSKAAEIAEIAGVVLIFVMLVIKRNRRVATISLFLIMIVFLNMKNLVKYSVDKIALK